MICRRCLLAEMESEKPLYALLREWLAALAPEEKAASETYGARLAVCRKCEQLTNGMCALCGCYVELRAAKTCMGCPSPKNRW